MQRVLLLVKIHNKVHQHIREYNYQVYPEYEPILFDFHYMPLGGKWVVVDVVSVWITVKNLRFKAFIYSRADAMCAYAGDDIKPRILEHTRYANRYFSIRLF